jgi:hypothetical protein
LQNEKRKTEGLLKGMNLEHEKKQIYAQRDKALQESKQVAVKRWKVVFEQQP